MIFRRRNKDAPFTVIPNYTLKDGSLKPESLGVLCFLLSHRDDWSISARQIANHFGISTGRVNTIATDLSRHLEPEDYELIRKRQPGGKMRLKSVEAGAATSVYAATAPELEGRGGV